LQNRCEWENYGSSDISEKHKWENYGSSKDLANISEKIMEVQKICKHKWENYGSSKDLVPLQEERTLNKFKE